MFSRDVPCFIPNSKMLYKKACYQTHERPMHQYINLLRRGFENSLAGEGLFFKQQQYSLQKGEMEGESFD